MASHAHTHHEHSGKQLVEEARVALTEAGEQWTGMRAAVFEELARHDRPASAYDIADNLSAARGKRVADPLDHRPSSVEVEFDAVLTGVAVRSLEPQYKRLVQLSTLVAKIPHHGLARRGAARPEVDEHPVTVRP